MNRGWEAKRDYTKGVSNKRIEMVSKKAIENGAHFFKSYRCRRGRGRFFIYASPSKHRSIINSLKKLGVSNVDFKYQNQGAKVFEINNL